MTPFRRLTDREERQHAFSRHQLMNHGYHAGVGLAIYIVIHWILCLHAVHAVAWVLAVGAGKEYFETIRKVLRGDHVWTLDSLLDLAGWLAPAILLALLFG